MSRFNVDPDSTIDFCATIEWETDKAYKLSDGVETFWIPKSQVEEKRRVGYDGGFEFTIPEWLAIDKGII